jgi:hypothetical protein
LIYSKSYKIALKKRKRCSSKSISRTTVRNFSFSIELLFFREKKIQELLEEANQIKCDFDDYKKSHSKNEKKYIEVQKQMMKYQSIMKQLNEIVVTEEVKRGVY